MSDYINISGWGNYPAKIRSKKHQKGAPYTSTTIRGAGRSYGDAAMGKEVYTLEKHKELKIDGDLLIASGKVHLIDILNFILPQGFFFPVIPGTQHVTLGGMIAMDVHGKNHWKNGSIGEWVEELEIELGNGNRQTCSSSDNQALFQSTIGGLGLTGIIHRATIRLLSKSCFQLVQSTITLPTIESLCQAIWESASDYQVGWINTFNYSQNLLFEADQTDRTENNKTQVKGIKTIPRVPFRIPSNFLMRQYNKRYFEKNKQKAGFVDVQSFFFPLDKLDRWNRLYGPKGFIQYQFVVPFEKGISTIETIMAKIQQSPFQPWLSVIKKMRKNNSPGIISFPMKGFTIALDFPRTKGLISFLHELDEIIIKNGGRIYLAKDAILQPENFQKMYPKHKDFKEILKEFNHDNWTSDLAQRLKILQ